MKNLRMFEKLCGEDFNRIVLTTTMWNEVDEELGVERETELKEVYWKSMIERGSSVQRFLYTRESAFEILAPFFEEVEKRGDLLVQREMNERQLQLNETSAGRLLKLEFEDLVARHQGILDKIRRETRDPTVGPEQFQVSMEEYRRVSVELKRVTNTEDMQTTKTSMRGRIFMFLKYFGLKFMLVNNNPCYALLLIILRFQVVYAPKED